MKISSEDTRTALLLAASIVIPNLIIIKGYFPYLGIAISLIIIATNAYLFKVKKTYTDKFYFIAALIFSFFIFYIANNFLTFLNIVAAVYTISLLSINYKLRKRLGLLQILALPLLVFSSVVNSKNKYGYENLVNKTKKETRYYLV